MKLIAVALLSACLAFAGEYAVLYDGSRIYADGHENAGVATIRLNTPEGSRIILAERIAYFVPGDAMRVPDPPFLLPQALSLKGPFVPDTRAASRPIDTHALIHAAARKHSVPPALVRSIIAAESDFRQDAVSNKGAIGLMQLMPQTAQALGADPNIPEQNVDAGTRYLRYLLDKYRRYRDALRRAIAAYNAGPAMVDRYHGVPPFPETRNYVARVLAYFHMFQRAGL